MVGLICLLVGIILGGMLMLVFVTDLEETWMRTQGQKYQGLGAETCQNGRPLPGSNGDGEDANGNAGD